jgi:hypothetical protein
VVTNIENSKIPQYEDWYIGYIDDVRKYFKAPELPLTFLGLNYIRRALPVCADLYYNRPLSDFVYNDHIFLAGDYLLNPSLDAAMRSGEMAVKALLSQKS